MNGTKKTNDKGKMDLDAIWIILNISDFLKKKKKEDIFRIIIHLMTSNHSLKTPHLMYDSLNFYFLF